MRLISERDLLRRLEALRDKYNDSGEPMDHVVAVGLDRAITEVVLSPTEGRKTND